LAGAAMLGMRVLAEKNALFFNQTAKTVYPRTEMMDRYAEKVMCYLAAYDRK